MTEFNINKKKLIPFLVILSLLILGTFHLNFGYAMYWGGDGATVYPDDEHPTQYGVFIPQPNMYSTMLIDASKQGNFTLMDWWGDLIDNEEVTYPGMDISELFPWYFDDYIMDTTTNYGYINPWLDINWINITAYNTQADNNTPYTFNSVFNYHVMTESSKLMIPLNSSIPMQVDIFINNEGPKVLKFDWLTDVPSTNPFASGRFALISPSGKILDTDDMRLAQHNVVMASSVLFRYLTFVAHEKGTYRLLMKAAHTEPTHLTLEFMNTPLSALPLNTLKFGGNIDDSPSGQDGWDLEWQNNWYKIDGEEGDLFRLDIGTDFYDDWTPNLPIINLWLPCDNGYIRRYIGSAGTRDIYFPTTGTAYLSFIDDTVSWWYRYSLFLEEFEVLNYTIGYDLYTTKISRDQRKAIEFEVDEDSFVRFNYTLFDQPAGLPTIYADGTDYALLYEDSNNFECYDVINYLESKSVASEDYYYYYLPAGTYKALLRNDKVGYDGVIQISSKYVDYVNDTIPISSLTYPNMNPSQFLTLEFDPDEYYNNLYESQCVYINITESGQYFLNTTISASDNLAAIPTIASPSVVLGYNASVNGGEYYDYTTEALALDNNTFKAFYNNAPADQLYIAYTSKWHDMHFILTQGGEPGPFNGGVENYVEVYDGNNWNRQLSQTDDTTNEFVNNGTWILNMDNPNFDFWESGVGTAFDLPHIDENQYYWLRFICDELYDPYIPYFDRIQLSNITLHGDVNLELVGESGYNYADYWRVPIGDEPTGLIINPESENSEASEGTLLFDNSYAFPWIPNPYMIGFEEGTYKLLITPHGFGYPGSIKIRFGVENYWPYRHQASYNITAEPNLYMHQIKNYTASAYTQDNITFYNYGKIIQYNDTEASVADLWGYTPGPPYSDPSYFVLECFGNAYQWTQLVISTSNVSRYTIYLMQDLPWVVNAPNSEVKPYWYSGADVNYTMEFGVFVDHFYLIFEVDDLTELVTFRIDLNQYNTTILTTSVPIAKYKAPAADYGALILGLTIGIPVAAGIIVVIYVLKKKGRILSKTP